MCFDEKELFLDMCTDFSLVRNGKTIKTSIKGFFCDNRYPHSIQVLYDYGIQPEDCLIHEKSRMRYIIDEVLPVTDNEYILHYRSPADAPASSISIGTIPETPLSAINRTRTLTSASLRKKSALP